MSKQTWVISKEFDFDFGHRVWSQTLDHNFSIDSKCKCRFFHGHRGKLIVKLISNKLSGGMITDFNHLNIFKKFIDNEIDHKFLFDLSDPILSHEFPHISIFPVPGSESVLNNVEGMSEILGAWWKCNLLNNDTPEQCGNRYWWTINLDKLSFLPLEVREKYEGAVFVPFIPTAENLSMWFHQLLSKMFENLNVQVYSVMFYETPKSVSEFIKRAVKPKSL